LLASTGPQEYVPPYLAEQPADEVDAFLDAATSFFEQRPWRCFDRNKYIGFRVGNGAWQYAQVLGHDGQEFGLGLFDGWLDLCRFMWRDISEFEDWEAHDDASLLFGEAEGGDPMGRDGLEGVAGDDELFDDDPFDDDDLDDDLDEVDPDDEELDGEYEDEEEQAGTDYGAVFDAVDALESITLGPLPVLPPMDAACYVERGVQPLKDGDYPLIVRATKAGRERPGRELSVYSGLLRLLAERARRAPGRVSSITAELPLHQGLLQVRYPSRGDEESDRTGYYRIGVPFELEDSDPDLLRVRWVAVEAPGESKWHQLSAAALKAARELPDVDAVPPSVRHGSRFLWLDEGPGKEPSPTLDQLAGLGEIVVDLLGGAVPLRIERLPRPVPAPLRVVGVEEA
jgi:hypothetical protein